MVFWSAVFAALAGWGLTGFTEYGFFIGGFAGLVFGLGARKAVRAEIAAATATLRAEIVLLRETPEARATAGGAAQPIAPPMEVVAMEQRPLSSPPADLATEPRPPFQGEPTSARAPASPPEPKFVATALAAALAAARGWLLGGNTIVRVGLVILFVGLSFLASYAASAGLFPIEWRLALIVVFGIVLLAAGFRTRIARPGFGLALQGGGVALIYLTLFAAAKLYATISASPAFILMIVVCALGCALALLQRSQALAVTAFAGGFAVPLLLSDGGGNVAGLFAYYTILNVAILFIAGRQSWRVLNLIGFFATFGVMSMWEATSYRPVDFAVAQGFLIVSVLIYVATAVLYTRRTPRRLGNVVDTTLLFGPALAGFGLEVGLVHDRAFGSAFAALGFAALYLGVAAFTRRYRRENLHVMNETMLAIGIGFVTMAVPLALGARWTSAAWALEGAGAFWVGMRQARWMPRLFGLLLQLIAALIYLGALGPNMAALPLANPAFAGALLIAVAGLATAWWLRTPLPHSGSRWAERYAQVEHALGNPAFLYAFGFWWLAWAVEAARLAPPVKRGLPPLAVWRDGTRALLIMLAYVASAWGAQAIDRRLRWPVAGWPAYTTLAALFLGVAGEFGTASHVLYTPDWAIWIVAIGLHLRMLYLIDIEGDATARLPIVRAAHAGGVWLACALLADCLLLAIDRAALDAHGSWAEATVLTTIAVVLAGMSLWAAAALRMRAAASRWPLTQHAVDYGWYAAAPVAALLVLVTLLVAFFSSGSADPLPFVPLINPADLSIAFALAAVELWRRTVIAAGLSDRGAGALDRRGARATMAALAFVAVNTAWLRVAHHLLGVPWNPDALLASVVVQTGLAILWTLLALALMVLAHRRVRRTVWLAGAGLLGLTVAKLLLVDMNTAGGGARIVAFIAVGLLMLVVGYLAPLPPRTTTSSGATREGVPA